MDETSFLDNEDRMIVDSAIQQIGEHLFNEWRNSHLDEGILYADYQIALMCDSDYLKRRYNEHWKLTPDDEYYVEFVGVK
jgi:hypothetical protein